MLLPPQCLSTPHRLFFSQQQQQQQRISCILTTVRRSSRTAAALHHKHVVGQIACRRRALVTLAIETSCDDTAVAVLSKSCSTGKTRLIFNERVSSDNRAFQGINPMVTVQGHNASLAPLVEEALQVLRRHEDDEHVKTEKMGMDKRRKMKMKVPDFVCATRGPGIMANLAVGLNVAKGLALAWGVPFVGVHHMQAHALTPRLVDALNSSSSSSPSPSFPFLSLLVSGGHTQLILSTSLTAHKTLASTADVAIGNLLDQTARVILPPSILASSPDVSYGRLLEAFAFPPPTGRNNDNVADYEAFFQPARSRGDEIRDVETKYGWTVPVPLKGSRKLAYSFSSIYTHVHNIAAAANARTAVDDDNSNVEDHQADDGGDDRRFPLEERRALARHTLRAAFQHLASRLVLALQDSPSLQQQPSPSPSSSQTTPSSSAAASSSCPKIKTLVVAGGVASNRFLMHVLRTTLAARGFPDMRIVAPPLELCTDNAAMIAWAGMEMFEAGFRSELSVRPIARWPMDPDDVGGGILGAGGWVECGGGRSSRG